MPALPGVVEEYLASLPDGPRAALEGLRETIRGAAPGSVERISYRMPAFELDGRILVWYAAFKNHCSLFPATERVVAEHGAELEPYLSGKGTIRFTLDDPLPTALVEKVVETRIAENEAARRR